MVYEQVVISAIKGVTGMQKVEASHTLVHDLHMDSLDRVEVLLEIESSLCREFPDSDFVDCVTVQDIIDIVQRVAEEQSDGS